jgi:hypothetical protein
MERYLKREVNMNFGIRFQVFEMCEFAKLGVGVLYTAVLVM